MSLHVWLHGPTLLPKRVMMPLPVWLLSPMLLQEGKGDLCLEGSVYLQRPLFRIRKVGNTDPTGILSFKL